MVTNANDIIQKHRLTVEEYHRMGDTGILKPQERVELIEGEVVDMSPIGSNHAGTVNYLNNILNAVLYNKAIVSAQSPIVLGDHSEPEPDIVILKPKDDFYSSAHPIPDDIFLVMEVSDTSLRYDREIKIPLYAKYNIPEVWLIDIENQTLTIYHSPTNGQYQSEQIADTKKSIAVQAFPEIELDLSKLFNL